MFRFDGAQWVPFSKKITFTQTVTAYDDFVTDYPANATVEDFTLTDEQMARLETVKHLSLSVEDLTEYVLNGEIQSEPVERADKANRQRKAFLSAIDLATVDPEILKESDLSKEWEPDAWMEKEDLIKFEDTLYTVLQPHKSQSDWTPDTAVSLYAPLLTSPSGEALPWVQPGSTNPYMKGDRVIYKGKVYESLIDNNVWSPDGYPAGWKEVV